MLWIQRCLFSPVGRVAAVHGQQRVQVLSQVVRPVEHDRHHRRHHAVSAGRRPDASIARCGRRCFRSWCCRCCRRLYFICRKERDTLSVLSKQLCSYQSRIVNSETPTPDTVGESCKELISGQV